MGRQRKIALVTGAGRRGGRTIALELGRRGIDVAVHYNQSRQAAIEVKRQLIKMGVRAELFRADLSKWAEVRRLVSRVRKKFGWIDILINNASNFLKTPFGTVRERDWDLSLDTNLKGPFFLCQEFGREMRQRGGGVIVNIADWAVDHPYPNYLPYCISKAGIVTLTKGLQKVLGPKVKVRLISPRVLKGFSGYAREVGRLVG